MHSHRHSRRSFLAGLLSCGLATGLLTPLDAPAATGRYRQTALFMGTFVTIDAAGVSGQHADDAIAAAFAEGRRLEALLTRHDPAAPLGVLNAQGRLADVPGELRCVLDLAADMHAASAGAFDPTILPVLTALESPAVTRAELERLYACVDYTRLSRSGDLILPSGMAVTLDGIAKGQVAQAMSDTLYRHGVVNHLVNAGGDIVARGCPEPGRRWRVAVEDPGHRGRYPSVVELGDTAIATSGVYERRLGSGASHLVHPASMAPCLAVSASVIAPAGARADALATAFSVMDPDRALAMAGRLPGVALCLVLGDGRVRASTGWPA